MPYWHINKNQVIKEVKGLSTLILYEHASNIMKMISVKVMSYMSKLNPTQATKSLTQRIYTGTGGFWSSQDIFNTFTWLSINQFHNQYSKHASLKLSCRPTEWLRHFSWKKKATTKKQFTYHGRNMITNLPLYGCHFPGLKIKIITEYVFIQ